MKITRFEDLDVWKESTSLAIDVYQMSKNGELSKDFGLRDQIRRAAVSIASNIAEGKERETVKEFIRYLYIAKGSAGELRTQLYIACQVGYIGDKYYQELNQRVEKISGMIGNLIKALKKNRQLLSRWFWSLFPAFLALTLFSLSFIFLAYFTQTDQTHQIKEV